LNGGFTLNLNNYRDEAETFLKKLGVQNETLDIKISMLEEELNLLKKAGNNQDLLKHQIYDMLFILFEIASDYNFDLEEEWMKGRIRKDEKYITK
jgi:hypothetical protein